MDAKDGWIDVAVSLRSGMVRWPDNPRVRNERVLDTQRGDVASVSKISMDSHTGTHVDAPLHFVRGGEGMGRMPLGATVGWARVVEVRDPVSVKPKDLRGIGHGERRGR